MAPFHGSRQSRMSMPSSLSVDLPLATARPPPLGLQFDKVTQSYHYDSSTRNRRTGHPLVGTGIPCGALAKEEQEDTASFLDMIGTYFPQLAQHLRDHYTSSRIFSHRIAGLELALGKAPVLHLVSGHRTSLDAWEKIADITMFLHRPTVNFEVFSGTLHRISHHDTSSHTVFFRLGRRRPSVECQRIVQDLIQRLIPRRLTVLRVTGCGKTTVLREMIRQVLVGTSANVGVMSATGELSHGRVVNLEQESSLSLLKSLDVICMDGEVDTKMWRRIQAARVPCIVATDYGLPNSTHHFLATLSITHGLRYCMSHPRRKKRLPMKQRSD